MTDECVSVCVTLSPEWVAICTATSARLSDWKKKKNSSSFSYKHSNLHTYLWVCYVTSPKTGSHKIQKKKKTSKHYPPQAWQSAASGMNSICENKRWIINLDDADLTVPSSSVGGFVFVPKGHLNPTKSQSSALYNVKRCKTACFSASLS